MKPGRRRSASPRLGVQGELWITAGGAELGGSRRMDLLRAVAEQGSITQAAKAQGISYKAAWDNIDAMNLLSGEPLVQRATGGRGGGSTRLTERGLRLVERYGQIEAVHRRFVKLLQDDNLDLAADFSLLKALNMKTTARNQFLGKVTAVKSGAVNDQIELRLPGDERLVAIVTSGSTESLALRTGQSAIALIQASNVILATGLDGARFSARNQLGGTVGTVTPGAVNSEVTLELAGGATLVAIVTQASVQSLGLMPGVRATALVKASDVILAVMP